MLLLVFSSNSPIIPQEVRAIAEGRIAYLKTILTYESTGSLVPFLKLYLDKQDIKPYEEPKDPHVTNRLYAQIFLTAKVYIGWYEDILRLLETPAQENKPETLYFMIDRAQKHMCVKFDVNGTETRLDKCNLCEEKYFSQIQSLLYNSCDLRLFLQLSCRTTPQIMCQNEFSKIGVFQKQCSSELARHPSPMCEEILKDIECKATKHFKALPTEETYVSGPKEQGYTEKIINFYLKCLTSPMTIERDRLLAGCSEKYKDFFKMDQYSRLVRTQINRCKYYQIFKEINEDFKKLLRQIDANKIRLRLQQEALVAVVQKEERRRNAIIEDSNYMYDAFAFLAKEKNIQILQLILHEKRQQLLIEEENARVAIFTAASNPELYYEMQEAEAQARTLLPWTAFLSSEEQEAIAAMKQQANSVNTDLSGQPEHQILSEDFFKTTTLSRCITDIKSGQPSSQHEFLSALGSFGRIKADSGGSERRYDVWDIRGVRHCGFFHVRHGQDLSVTKTDWRFANIVNVLERAGYLTVDS